MYVDHTNKRFLQNLGILSEELKELHVDQNLAGRSGHGTFDWTRDHVDTKYMHHCNNFAKLLRNTIKLQQAGFAMQADDIDGIKEDVIAEDCFADFLGRSILSIVDRRLYRGLHFMWFS